MQEADAFDTQESSYPKPFGRYLLLSSLGKGGMGEVHLAKQSGVEGIDRHCVIKRLRLRRTRTREDVERFLDEARVVVQLSHRNICRVFDVGEVDDELFLAMDLVSGRDLRSVARDLTKRGERIPLPLALLILKELLIALDYAHRLAHPVSGEPLHLVHRDVSPHNVMLSYEGEVVLIDFGLAASRLKEHQTEQGQAFGKLAYMAPEQLRGTGVDARTDVYAAGIVAFELATGQSFFGDASPDALLRALSSGDIPQPDWSTLPGALVPIVQRAVALEAHERFASCADFREELEAFERSLDERASESDLRAFMARLYPNGPADLRNVLGQFSEMSASLPSRARAAASASDATQVTPNVSGSDTAPVSLSDQTELVTREAPSHDETQRVDRAATVRQPMPRRRGRLIAAGLVTLALIGTAALLLRDEPAPPANISPKVVKVEPVGEPAPPEPKPEPEPETTEPTSDLAVESEDEPDDEPEWTFEDSAPEPAPAPKPRARRTRRPKTTTPKPVLGNLADKLKFLKTCRRSCAPRITGRASAVKDMPQQEARAWFDALDRCVRACGG